jgi:hypothetical protein
MTAQLGEDAKSPARLGVSGDFAFASLGSDPTRDSQSLTTWVPPANSSCLPCLVGLLLIVTAITM